ncbi:hypothetical protein Droror1_Dr00018161 [Drosera rotundifolia]
MTSKRAQTFSHVAIELLNVTQSLSPQPLRRTTKCRLCCRRRIECPPCAFPSIILCAATDWEEKSTVAIPAHSQSDIPSVATDWEGNKQPAFIFSSPLPSPPIVVPELKNAGERRRGRREGEERRATRSSG